MFSSNAHGPKLNKNIDEAFSKVLEVSTEDELRHRMRKNQQAIVGETNRSNSQSYQLIEPCSDHERAERISVVPWLFVYFPLRRLAHLLSGLGGH